MVEGHNQKEKEVVEGGNQKKHKVVEMDLDIVEVGKSLELEHANFKLLRPHTEVNYREKEDNEEKVYILIFFFFGDASHSSFGNWF